jgi:hypothetical protein
MAVSALQQGALPRVQNRWMRAGAAQQLTRSPAEQALNAPFFRTSQHR